MRAKVSKKLLIPLLVIIIAGIATMSYMFRGAENSVANEKALYTRSADALYSSFEGDETAANEKFLGKVIEVTGEVSEIEKTDSGQLVVLLSCNSPIGGISCTFETKQDQVSKLVSPGATCTIKGKCSGMLMEVVLDNCALTNY
jgi:hypothetical protein